MIQRFDLVIVGGSFAGLACARTAALRGLKVAVIDAKPEPGARVSTTGIVVKEASDEFDMPAQFMRKVRGVRLYSPDDRSLALHAPGYFFQATNTAELLRWMAREAERAGAVLRYRTRFEHAIEHEKGVNLTSLDIHARFLIGADGARSRVAETFHLGRNKRFLVGLELECEPLQGVDPRFLHCFADSHLAPGYIAWVVPGVGVTQIGLASRRPEKLNLAALLRRLKSFWDIREIRVLSRRSGVIPTGGTLTNLGTSRVMLVGDAAGTVSPVTGGGIHTALRFGRRAAQLVSDYLGDRGEHPVQVMAREVPRYHIKGLLRQVMDFVPPNPLINALLMTEPVRALAQRIYFHSRAGDLGSYAAWAEAFERGDLEPGPQNSVRPILKII